MKFKALAIASFIIAMATACHGVEEGRVKPAPPPVKMAEFKARDALAAYQRQLRDSYALAGVPPSYIERLIPLDVEIYNARVAGDLNRVRLLRTQEQAICTP